jgi:integrase
MIRCRYQRGCLRCTKRKVGPDCWEFLWREKDETGKCVRRAAAIGNVEKYPTRDLAEAAIMGFRMQINEDRLRQPDQQILVGDLVDHYLRTELHEETIRHSHATRIVYREFLTRWIRPHWGKVNVRSVRTVTVERWLRLLQRANGDPLANSTKAKIRGLFSVLFNHAIRHEWLGQGRNPITLVRQSAKRHRTPEVLEASEIQSLLQQLTSCFRMMVLLEATTGLRRSELFALKWRDVDFSDLRLDVVRSIYWRHIGDCKTEASRKPLPLDERVAADLWLWKETTRYGGPDDWILASPRTKGKYPFWPDAVLQKVIRPAALKAGIHKRIAWHTFRHTFSTLLIANGENVKVVQEPMRHASSRCTLEVYSQARIVAKRQAQQRVAQMILPEEAETADPGIACRPQIEIR